jgi:hypothetical protein
MTAKSKRILLGSVLFVIIAIASAGFFLYNKGPVDIKNSKGIPVSATDLYALYSHDSLEAGKKYNDRILVVRGEVAEISLNSQQQKIILLKTGTSQAFINCTLEEPDENIKVTDEINIKGICSGIGEGYPDMGISGDVYLTRCFIAK